MGIILETAQRSVPELIREFWKKAENADEEEKNRLYEQMFRCFTKEEMIRTIRGVMLFTLDVHSEMFGRRSHIYQLQNNEEIIYATVFYGMKGIFAEGNVYSWIYRRIVKEGVKEHLEWCRMYTSDNADIDPILRQIDVDKENDLVIVYKGYLHDAAKLDNEIQKHFRELFFTK